MKILAFAASNSKTSINKALVTHASQVLKAEFIAHAEIEIIDLNDFEMPIYSADREKENGIPRLAHQFFEKISASDALLISYAEHNGLYTAAFKNIFDWASRIDMKVFQDKPMLAMSASVGKNGGANVLKTALGSAPFFGAKIVGSFSVGPFTEHFIDDELVTPELAKDLRHALKSLIEKDI
ncbi:MAG: NAD(P)H-dependent oxidoreductase [Pseudomonadota bacterium]